MWMEGLTQRQADRQTHRRAGRQTGLRTRDARVAAHGPQLLPTSIPMVLRREARQASGAWSRRCKGCPSRFYGATTSRLGLARVIGFCGDRFRLGGAGAVSFGGAAARGVAGPARELWRAWSLQVTTLTWARRGHWKWDFVMGMLSKEERIITDKDHVCFDDLYLGRHACPSHPQTPPHPPQTDRQTDLRVATAHHGTWSTMQKGTCCMSVCLPCTCGGEGRGRCVAREAGLVPA
jgi:hypothetical protein